MGYPQPAADRPTRGCDGRASSFRPTWFGMLQPRTRFHGRNVTHRRLGERRRRTPAGNGGKHLEGAAMARTAALPIVTAEGGLSHYLEQIRRFPMLEPKEEYMLAKRWREHGDRDAAHKLVTSHLRLVAKIAMGYRGYGLPISEVVSEGNVGLMQAVKRFEPDKG